MADKKKSSPSSKGADQEEIQKIANTGAVISCPYEPSLKVNEGCTALCGQCSIRTGGLYDSMGFIY